MEHKRIGGVTSNAFADYVFNRINAIDIKFEKWIHRLPQLIMKRLRRLISVSRNVDSRAVSFLTRP